MRIQKEVKDMNENIYKSSNNIFSDLGLNDADEMLAKVKIAAKICDIIYEQKLTQTKASKILGIDQPKVSALMKGRLDGFSSDRLFRFLNALGQDIEITIRPAIHHTPHINVASL